MKSISVGAARADVLEHRRHVGVVPLGGERLAPADRVDVHLPGIFVELDAGGGGNRLPLVHQVADEMAEVGRLRPAAANAPTCGRSVSAATVFTVALKISFDHCAGRRSGKARARSPEATSSASTSCACSYVAVPANGPEPGLGVELVLDVRVARAGRRS